MMMAPRAASLPVPLVVGTAMTGAVRSLMRGSRLQSWRSG